MRYEGSIYRPPSEAYSYILQTTIGCSHNQCTFCGMYKDKAFRVRPITEIMEDLAMAAESYDKVKRIFLADGNALIMKQEDLKRILSQAYLDFPELERVSLYAAPKDILRKSKEELLELREMGLEMVYLGVESGSDLVLDKVKKGATSKEIIEGGKKINEAGIALSVTLIMGLGGEEHLREHALESARVVNEIQPKYLSLLTLLIQEQTPLKKDIDEGLFVPLDPMKVLEEVKLFIEGLNLKNSIFRSNHPSNYLSLDGDLPKDKDRLLKEIDQAIGSNGEELRKDLWRRL